MCDTARQMSSPADPELQPLDQYQPAAARFTEESLFEWDNSGPTFRATADRRTVWVAPWDEDRDRDRETNWRQMRGDLELGTAGGPSGLFEFSIMLERLKHPELMLGVVLETAPKQPLCLHSSKPSDGVFLFHVGFEYGLKSGDVLSLLLDLNIGVASLCKNGAVLPGNSMSIPKQGIFPVVELYHHREPKISIVRLQERNF